MLLSTVFTVKQGEAVVNCKAKTRSVFIVKELKQKLLRYAAEQGIKNGMIFVARTGKPISRTTQKPEGFYYFTARRTDNDHIFR